MIRLDRFLFVLLSTALLVVGCGQPEPPASETGTSETTTSTDGGGEATTTDGADSEGTANMEKDESAAPADTKTASTEPPATPTSNETPASPASSTPPATADAAALKMMKGIADNRAGEIWEFLPASYQKDVNDVTHMFAEKMDKDVWNASFATLQKTASILKSKKENILTMLNKEGGPGAPPELEENWDDVVGLISTLINSEISDIDKLKTIDMGKYLGTTGSTFLKQVKSLAQLSPTGDPFAKISEFKAEVISTEDGVATVRLEMPGEEPKEEEFVQVEGKWIPKELADEWADGITNAKASLEEVDTEQIEQTKGRILAMLKGLDSTLNMLAEAESQDAFEVTAQQLVGQVIGSAMMFGGGAGGPDAGPGPGPSLGTPEKPESPEKPASPANPDDKKPADGDKKDDDKPAAEVKKDADKPAEAKPAAAEKKEADKPADGDKKDDATEKKDADKPAEEKNKDAA